MLPHTLKMSKMKVIKYVVIPCGLVILIFKYGNWDCFPQHSNLGIKTSDAEFIW